MALQANQGMQSLFVPRMASHIRGGYLPIPSDNILDAANEAIHFIGHVWLAGRTGSKTISSSGGSIKWSVGSSAVFSNAGTTLRVGIQDLSTSGPPGRGDGTFDVYTDLVGGTATISSNTINTSVMTSGTKTLNHGDLVAIVLNMSSRGGSDSVPVRVVQGSAATVSNLSLNRPTVTTQFTSTYTTQNAAPMAAIVFDDGTYGFIDGSWFTSTSNSTLITNSHQYNVNSTPDEYALIFQTNFKCRIDGISVLLGLESGNADFEAIVYSDPLGTPSALSTITIDNVTTQSGVNPRIFRLTLPSELTLDINTSYAISVRPTTTTNVTLFSYDFENTSQMAIAGSTGSTYYGTRSNQTGAFSTTTTRIPYIFARISALDDGVGGGGGGASAYTFVI